MAKNQYEKTSQSTNELEARVISLNYLQNPTAIRFLK
jgi:hypothetical protein